MTEQTQQRYRIAVIEDNPKHLSDVQRLMNERQDLIDVAYATNLEQALKLLGSREFDGILSDAHFPEREGDLESTCGIQIIDYAMEKKEFPVEVNGKMINAYQIYEFVS